MRLSINTRRALGRVVLLAGALLLSVPAFAAPAALCDGIVCDDQNPCTDDTCNPADGRCVFTNNDANACSDGNLCTTDACVSGACVGSPVTCNDSNPCTTDTCNTSTGCVFTNNTLACSDGNACTTGDVCGGGSCQPGSATICDDSNVCTTDTCNTSTGCVFTNNTVTCSDGNACTLGDVCGGGTCHPGTPKTCNDGNVCTTDTCNTGTGACVFTNNTALCSDGNPCTTGDTCAGGSCQPGSAVVCTDNNACTDDSCNVSNGQCVFTNDNTNNCTDNNRCTTDACVSGSCVSTAVSCDDGNPCTDDSCNTNNGTCRHINNNTNACSDGNGCTTDACVSGVCVGTPSVVCNDQNACTDDACNPATGFCVFTNDNTNACNDGNACTSDACVSGTCVGTPSVNCNDGNACTDDACIPATGQCAHTSNNANPCSDGSRCTTDLCVSGVCVGTPSVFCDDGNPCTDDACNPANGLCVFTNDNAHPCADGTACTTPACVAGACVCSVPLSLWTSSAYPAGLNFGTNMGLSWGDYDADGAIDVFNAYARNLWRNVAGASWQHVGDFSTSIPETERRYGSSFGDYDNDGLPDIAVSSRAPQYGDDKFHLLHNLGGGPNFTDVAGDVATVDVQPYGNAETLCWADVDGDRNLDLFVPEYPGTLGPGNFFLHNLGPTGPVGAYRFAEMSGPAGLDVPPDTERPEGAQFADVDFDGDVDLYANNTLYQNISAKGTPNFLALSESASGIGLRGYLDEGAMFFDYDLDGDLDLVVAYVDASVGVKIWENRGDGTFFAAESTIIDSRGTGLDLGMSAEDWDNDGDIDFTTREVFRRNMLVEDGTRHFTVEAHTIAPDKIDSALPAWGDWDGDGDLDCALGNWGKSGFLFENKLYNAATPLADRRYVRVRAVRDSAVAPRGLEVEYGASVEVRIVNRPDPFRRRKFVASSHGYLNQNQYTLQFGLPPRIGPGPDVAFDVFVDFPNAPTDGYWRVDKHVNPVLGAIDLGALSDREITVDRSGRVVIQGVAYDAIAGASPRLSTTTGGLALPGPGALSDPIATSNLNWYVGLAFDTLETTTPLSLREIIFDGQLADPVDCGAGPANLVLWDMTDVPPAIVAAGALLQTTSDRNRRSYFTTDIALAPGRKYRLVAHVSRYRMSPVAAPIEADGITVRGGALFDAPACSLDALAAASVDASSVPLAIRFAPAASGSCLGRPAAYCDDQNPCTADTCSPAGSCVHTNGGTAACDDANACTTADTCANGVCAGTAVNCNDGNVCTTDSCNPSTGCAHVNNTAMCNDGSLCTLSDVCSGGICVGTSPRNCDDGNPCTDDACNPATGCFSTTDDSNACSDSNLCTSADHCVAGVCTGTTVNCDDGVACTTDACGAAFGCVHTKFEVVNVRFTAKTTLSWNSLTGSAKYDVAAGVGSQLAVLGSGAGESCLVINQSNTSLTIAPTPAPGALFWYLVRAHNNSCGVGTYGFAYHPPAPAAERILTTCP